MGANSTRVFADSPKVIVQVEVKFGLSPLTTQAPMEKGQSAVSKSAESIGKAIFITFMLMCISLQVKSHAQKEFNKWKAHAELKHFVPPRAGSARDGEHEVLAARVFGRSGERCELSSESLESDPLLPADIDVTDEDTMDAFADWICA